MAGCVADFYHFQNYLTFVGDMDMQVLGALYCAWPKVRAVWDELFRTLLAPGFDLKHVVVLVCSDVFPSVTSKQGCECGGKRRGQSFEGRDYVCRVLVGFEVACAPYFRFHVVYAVSCAGQALN